MATNPMQRKSRNSFLLGMLVTLILSGAVIALLFMQLNKIQQVQKKEVEAKVKVYVLNTNVESGDVLIKSMFQLQEVNKNMIPSNATSSKEVIDSYALQDEGGNDIYAKTDSNGNATLYTDRKITTNTGSSEEKPFEIKNDKKNGNYYIEVNGQKEDIKFKETPIVAKINMNANTVITPELIAKSDEKTEKDTRKQEYNVVVLPMDLVTGDYIDIRLSLPSGQDYIVVSKKLVEIPQIAGIDSLDTIWMNMSEDEILSMSNAIYDAYKIKGSKLYATKYAEPGMQEPATPTYAVNQETKDLLTSDPNILSKAMSALAKRYGEKDGALMNLRNKYINSAINSAGEEAQSNVETGIQQSITNSQDARKEYLDSLSGVE